MEGVLNRRILSIVLFCWCLVVGCSSDKIYTVEGTVIEVMDDGRLMLEHEDIDGFMDAMTMPFHVANPEVIQGVRAGDRIVGQLVVGEEKAQITSLRVTLTTTVTRDASAPNLPAPVRVGEVFPSVEIPLAIGETLTLGAQQEAPVALTFIYTTCPMPEFCPAIVARLKQLVPLLEGSEAKIVAVTIDPKVDTMDVLNDYKEVHGLDPKRWHFGRVSEDQLPALITRAGMRMARQEGQVVHSKRLLILSQSGQLLERYDDVNWPIDRVAKQLKEGQPIAKSGASGTLTPTEKK